MKIQFLATDEYGQSRTLRAAFSFVYLRVPSWLKLKSSIVSGRQQEVRRNCYEKIEDQQN